MFPSVLSAQKSIPSTLEIAVSKESCSDKMAIIEPGESSSGLRSFFGHRSRTRNPPFSSSTGLGLGRLPEPHVQTLKPRPIDPPTIRTPVMTSGPSRTSNPPPVLHPAIAPTGIPTLENTWLYPMQENVGPPTEITPEIQDHSEHVYLARQPQIRQAYNIYLRRLEEGLCAMRDRHDRVLHDPMHVQEECLEVLNSNPTEDPTAGKQGTIMCFSLTTTGVHYSPVDIPVFAMTCNGSALTAADKACRERGFTEPAFRWVHLPGNNMEWVQVDILQHHVLIADPLQQSILHIQEHYIKPYAAPKSLQDPEFAPSMRDQILRTKYWSGQLSTGSYEIPHARCMRPFCSSIRIGTPYFEIICEGVC